MIVGRASNEMLLSQNFKPHFLLFVKATSPSPQPRIIRNQSLFPIHPTWWRVTPSLTGMGAPRGQMHLWNEKLLPGIDSPGGGRVLVANQRTNERTNEKMQQSGAARERLSETRDVRTCGRMGGSGRTDGLTLHECADAGATACVTRPTKSKRETSHSHIASCQSQRPRVSSPAHR